MPALRKPHRVAFLLPDVTFEGPDMQLEHEAALVVWAACIEACQRHPGLAVYDAESTPLFPQEAHFTPQHAVIGATPTDGFYFTTRRDELVWLELVLTKTPKVALFVLARDGKRDTFEAQGTGALGDQINHVLTTWLAARGLPPLPRRFPAATIEELLVVVKPIAPILQEQARAWALPTAPTWSLAAEDDDDSGVEDANADVSLDIDIRTADPAPKPLARSLLGRPVANKLPANGMKLPALRVLHLALREDLDDLILALDPEQPQALFAKFRSGARDFVLLRRVLAAAPCWAKPYAELVRDTDDRSEGDPQKPIAPSELETVAGAGIAALCRPQHLDVIERVADLLEGSGLVDEGVRMLERAQVTHHDEARAHLALLGLYPKTGRVGARLAQASRSAQLHGCPMDAHLPWYPDQIQVDLSVADALMNVGRLDEAIALRANRLEGREATWPRHSRILARWRRDPRFVAWCYALEGYFRGDPARTIEGFGRIQPGDDVDVAALLDALVATGREDEVALAWAELGLGRDHTGPVARLAAARALMSAGEWRRGMEEMWRVELGEPGRDEHVAIARCGQLLSCAPLAEAEAALGERVAIGAVSLAKRMARDIADWIPDAARSSVVTRALGKATPIEIEPSTFGGFGPETRSKKAIDKLFEMIAGRRDADLQFAEHVVSIWLETTYSEASDDDRAAIAQAATYMAAHALARYLAATTLPASPVTGALRTVASEALALVRLHRDVVSDRDARALLRVIEPLLRRVDRWIGSAWLGTVERSLGIDERAAGDVAGFAREQATIAARVLGPEESAVLATSIARLHRERPNNWAAAVVAQATQLALHTGYLGAEEWADAIVAQLAAKEIDVDDAIDELHTACYLTQGLSAGPAMHAARVLLDAGRGPAAVAVLVTGLPAAEPAWRDRQLATLADAWKRLSVDIPVDFEKVATQMFEALQKGDPARAEKLGRWAVAFDPSNGEAHRNLGLALAQQGKVPDALEHLVRATPEQATQILSGVLYQAGKLPDAMAVLDYASRWYVRADQWLTYGGIAYAAMDNPRTVRAYAFAYRLDPDAFDATQLNAYAGVLDEVGDYATCETIATHLLRIAGEDLAWKTNGWNHLACARIGQGRFDEAEKLATDAVTQNPAPDNAAAFATTLERAKAKATPPPSEAPATIARDPIYALIDASDLAGAVAAADKAGTPAARRAGIEAIRYRYASENSVAVTARARAAAFGILAANTTERDLDVCIARCTAMAIREQAAFARDPLPALGDRMTREAFYAEFRARGGVVLGDDAPPPPPFKDQIVVPGNAISRASDYIALLRDLAAIDPREALKQFGLDETSYLEVAKAWTAAMEADPAIAQTIAAGLAKR